MFKHEFIYSSDVLVNLSQKIIQADSHQYKVYLDIQIHYRVADDFATVGNYIEALDSFEKMKDAFDDVPSQFKDRYLRKKLNKCEFTLNKTYRQANPTLNLRVDMLRDWVLREAGN